MKNLKHYFRLIAYLIVFIAVLPAKAEDDNAAFFTAIIRDDGRTVMTYMIRGVNPNQKDPKGLTGLYIAIRDESWKAVDSLLQYPALDLNAANEAGETPLMMAALRGHLDIVKKLLARGARNSIAAPGWTALHYAASFAEGTPCVELLVKEGADINARSPNGTTPLMMASRYGAEGAVDVLLKAGADKTLRNEKGLTARDFAEAGGRPFLFQRLQ